MAAGVTGLRERTRRAVRGELMTAAMELFLESGYDNTTVEQIAVAAGLSRRSFFRYFTSKDEILSESLAGTGMSIAGALTVRPPDEAPWPALRRAFDVLLAQIATDDRARMMTQMMLQSPSMHASHAQKQTSWTASIAGALRQRLDVEGDDAELRAEALAAAALACLTAAQTRWVEPSNRQSLEALLDVTMGAVHTLDLPS